MKIDLDVVMTFLEIPNSLYCHETRASHSNTNSYDVIAYSFINTVNANKENYTRRQVTGADNDVAYHR